MPQASQALKWILKTSPKSRLESSIAVDDCKSLYVGGIDHDVHTEAALRAHFCRFGEIADLYFPKDRETGRKKTFCFVTFAAGVYKLHLVYP